MNRTENQFSTFNAACWFGAPRKERAPQASQLPLSSSVTVRHSRHSFGISRIMLRGQRSEPPPIAEKVMVLARSMVYRNKMGLTANWPQAMNAVLSETAAFHSLGGVSAMTPPNSFLIQIPESVLALEVLSLEYKKKILEQISRETGGAYFEVSSKMPIDSRPWRSAARKIKTGW